MDNCLPFVHRKLERTSYLQQLSKRNSCNKTPVRDLFPTLSLQPSPRDHNNGNEVTPGLYRETIRIPSQLSRQAVVGYLWKNIESINNKLNMEQPDHRGKNYWLERYRKLEAQKLKMLAKRKQNKAAKVIQSAFRKFIARKRYNEYIRKYNESQKRYMAALKIQYYYRSRRESKRLMEQEKKNRLHSLKKGEILHNMFLYIIKYQYRKLRLHMLLKKLDRMFASHRKELVLNSVIKIQYAVRRWLRALKKRRVQINKEIKPKKMKSRKRKIKKMRSKKFRIVNRGGKVMRINIKEEQRQKEEHKKQLDEIRHHSEALDFISNNIKSGDKSPGLSDGTEGFYTPNTSKNMKISGLFTDVQSSTELSKSNDNKVPVSKFKSTFKQLQEDNEDVSD